MMRLMDRVKAVNPICRAMKEYRKSTQETRDKVAEKGREALQKTFSGEKPFVKS